MVMPSGVTPAPAAIPPRKQPDDTTAPDTDVPRIVPRRNTGRRITAALALLLFAMVLNSVVRNDAFQWGVVGRYFTTAAVLDGLLLSLWLTAVVMVLGFLIGALLAVMRLSANPVLRTLSWGYVWIFRSTPLLVQLLFWFNIGALYPTLGLGVPFGPQFVTVQTVNLLGPTLTAVIGLTLHESAYAAEVVRGGILSVDSGQTEAAQALGLSRRRTLRRIVVPQAMRSIVPTAGNMLIGTLKGTSIVSVLAVHDLLYSVQLIYNQTYQIIPLLMVATLWYIAVTTALSIAQFYVERHYARGNSRALPPTPLQRLRFRLTALRLWLRRATAADARPVTGGDR
ncbi:MULTISPECIES: amino acid ABC transporter permease [Streptomyces]|uniref:Amino acid ABC transporter permease n=2 Tax=Streptomyces TaxID=1883 RepID=A0AB39NVW7_9ACTN|nr:MULTISPECIES: amino acid ABC transporter permease [Streptomyces]MCI4146101.1 amino acid ABC transporter permease [Streptomyces sp. MMS20-AI2-20]GGQ08679.1 putative amino acid ABC transporter, permease protein [Streptomyces gancidicus]GGS58390.1 putative amino acid ABC transporter, permease protein [Streptomyces rubiginosus]